MAKAPLSSPPLPSQHVKLCLEKGGTESLGKPYLAAGVVNILSFCCSGHDKIHSKSHSEKRRDSKLSVHSAATEVPQSFKVTFMVFRMKLPHFKTPLAAQRIPYRLHFFLECCQKAFLSPRSITVSALGNVRSNATDTGKPSQL
ncbi:hypothetical protein V6N13_082836 [Hibiscus sabdariffa]